MFRRSLFRGGFAVPVPPPFAPSGPYDPGRTLDDTILTQLHCHTTASDGSLSPSTVVADYLAAGYGALAITDHDKLTTQPAGIDIAIRGNELSPSTQHIISIDSTYTRGGTVAQTLINGVVAAGGKCHIAHPRWSTGMTYEEMAVLTGYMGMEIHNGHCITGLGQNPVTYPAFAVDRWDALLTDNRTDIWGFAVDDLHIIGDYETFDIGRVRAFVEASTVAGVVEALSSGNFVADVSNHNVTPGFPERDASGMSVTCAGATGIEAYGVGGVRLASSSGDTLTYSWDGDERYVRLEAIGSHSETFTSALSNRWKAVDGVWTPSGGVLSLTSTTAQRRLVLRKHRLGDFTASVDVKLPTGSSAGLMFNLLSSNYFYLLRLGASTAALYDDKFSVGFTTTNVFSGAPLDSVPLVADPDTWYTMKMRYTYATGLIEARVWEPDNEAEPSDWPISVAEASWGHGGFGFRGLGAPQFRNLTLDGFRTYYQPVTIEAA